MRGKFGQGRGRFGGRDKFERDESRGGSGFGRFLGQGDLRYVILSLLEQKPSHGYELIKSLEDLSSGNYSPSPGVIYPTLTFLEESGFATSSTDNNKKLFSITSEGQAILKEQKDTLKLILNRLKNVGEKVSRIKNMVGREDFSQSSGFNRSPIRAAMEELKKELYDLVDSKNDIKKQVAQLISSTAEQIRNLKKE